MELQREQPLQEQLDVPKYMLTQPEVARVAGVRNQAIAVQASKLKAPSYTVGNRTAYAPSVVRALFEQRNFKYPKLITAFQMLKGGSTKTTTLYNLLVRLNMYGARVLIIDADGQGNISKSLGHRKSKDDLILAHLIQDRSISIRDAIVQISDQLDLVPSNFGNAGIDITMFKSGESVAEMMKDIIAPVLGDYDFIFFDCNPALSALNNSIAFACDYVIMPVNPDIYAMDGLIENLAEYERMKVRHKREIQYRLIFTLNAHEAISRKYLIEYGTKFEDKLFNATIRRAVEVRNGTDENKSVFEMKGSKSRADYDEFALELLGWPVKALGEAEA